jgi:hypothetical protein
MAPDRFQRVPAAELATQPEDAILSYARRAARRGDSDEALIATQLMLFLHEERMEDRVAVRLPTHLAHHRVTVAAWVLERVTTSALRLQFAGTSVGEWVNWWSTAVDRQVIAFWRSARGQSLEAETGLPSEHDGEADGMPDRLGVPFDEDGVLSRALYGDIVQTVLDRMDNPMHVAVIRSAVLDDRASADVAAEYDTTANNVDAIKKRFREAVRGECLARGVTEP